MERKKVARLAGFTGAVCATAALAAVTVSSTGAYFTDSKSGNINASTGQIKVDISPGDGQLNFTDLLPGDFQTKTVTYYAHPRGGSEDVWLVLPAGAAADKLTDDSKGGGLGRYGHFEVNSPAGRFSSYNLSQGPGGCGIDANGHGGSDQQATSTNNADNGSYVPYCAAPHAILLSSGLSEGAVDNAQITFGFTKVLKGGQNGPQSSVAAFKIVATQHGVRPDDVNNAAN